MFKKFIISFLMAVVVLCGINFVGTTTAHAVESDATQVASATSKEKVATVNLAEKYPSGYAENTTLVFMDGENEVGKLTIDKASSNGSFGLRVVKNSVFSFVPNVDYNVKKLIYNYNSYSTNKVFNDTDSKYGEVLDTLSDDDEALLTQAGLTVNSASSCVVEFNSSYEATEEEPYEVSVYMNIAFGTICVVYEETGTYTRTHDCTSDKPTNTNATVKVGDATFPIKYEGTFNKGYPAYGDGSFRITINPVPGYVINYVIFTSPLDNPFDEKELKYPGLEATYENGNLTVTGMQVGQTYTVYSDGGAVGLLTSITVNYQKHEHSGVYEPGSDETHHFKHCECLWRVDEEEHDFDDGAITVEPTHQRKGTIEYTCSTCNYVKKEAVAPNLADTEVELLKKEFIYNGEDLWATINYVYYKGQKVSSSYYKTSGTVFAKTPGTYTFTIIPKPDSIFVGEKVVTFTIEKGNYDMSKVVFEDLEVTYNGSQFSIEATNLPNDVTVEYENNIGTNAGTYNAVAKFTLDVADAQYYNPIEDMTAKLVINKISVEKPTADSTVFTYNGKEQTYSLETSDLYDILDNTATTPDNYTVKVALKDKNNYQWENGNSDDLEYPFVINKATYDMSGVVFADKTVTYNGSAFSLEATNLPNGVTATYENNGKINAGIYTVTAKFTGNANYNVIADKTATLTIEQAVVTAPVADGSAFIYNGQAQTYALQTNSLYTISNTTFTDAGNHTIAVSLVDKTNYKWNNGNSNDLTYSFVIGKATYDMSGV
ncbi:MAG: hypothetical protein J6U92_03490, partial [Clostridia bacterium]|nr:hypothetical protein [Clostridia bacterium]